MKKLLQVIVALVLLSSNLVAQKYITKNGSISFYSSTPMEDIEAHNKQVNAALDSKTGDFVFKVLIKSFQFEKALMQEHFNENYMESQTYPKATFQGKITNLKEVNFSEAGSYEADIKGKLTIHGVSNDVKEKGRFIVSDDGIKAVSKFSIKLADYDIEIPNTVLENISKTIEISVDAELKLYK